MGERRLPPLHQPQLPLDLQLRHCNPHQRAALQLRSPPSASAPAPRRCPCCTNRLIASSDGSSTPICSGCLMPLERLRSPSAAAAKAYCAPQSSARPACRIDTLPAFASGCVGFTTHASSSRYTTIDFTCASSGRKRQHPNLHRMHQHLIGDPARQRPLHRHLDPRILPPELIQQRQQIKAGVLIRRQVQLAPVQSPQLRQRARAPPSADSATSAHTPAAPRPHRSACRRASVRSSSTSPSSPSSFAIA